MRQGEIKNGVQSHDTLHPKYAKTEAKVHIYLENLHFK